MIITGDAMGTTLKEFPKSTPQKIFAVRTIELTSAIEL